MLLLFCVREFMYMHFDHHQHQHHHHAIAMYASSIFALTHIFFFFASPNNRISVVFALNTAQCSCIPDIHLPLGNGSYGCYYSCCFCCCCCSLTALAFECFFHADFFSSFFHSSAVFHEFFCFVFKLFASLLHSFMNMYGKSACKCKSKGKQE